MGEADSLGAARGQHQQDDVGLSGLSLNHLKRASTYSEQGGRPLDSSAMYGIIRHDAGLDSENYHVKKRDA